MFTLIYTVLFLYAKYIILNIINFLYATFAVSKSSIEKVTINLITLLQIIDLREIEAFIRALQAVFAKKY